MLFRDVDGQSHLAFTRNYAGQQIIASDLPIFVYQTCPAIKNGNFSIGVLIFVARHLCAHAAVLAAQRNAAHSLRLSRGAHAQYRQGAHAAAGDLFLNLVFAGCYAAWLCSVHDNMRC